MLNRVIGRYLVKWKNKQTKNTLPWRYLDLHMPKKNRFDFNAYHIIEALCEDGLLPESISKFVKMNFH